MKTNHSPQASGSRPIDVIYDLPSNSCRTRASRIFQFGAVKKMVDKAKANPEVICGKFQFSPLVFSILLILTTLFTSIFHFSNIAWANDKEVIRVGNQTYSKSQIIRDFLTVSFSNTLWNEEFSSEDAIKRKFDSVSQLVENYGLYSNRDTKSKTYLTLRERFKKEAPWLWPYIAHENGFPKHNAINKWQKEITIGIDWPAFNSLEGKEPSGLPRVGVPRGPIDSYSVIQRQIEKLIPDLSKLTGLPVKFIEPGDPRERTEEFARIRIIPRGGSMWVVEGKPRVPFKTFKNITHSTFYDMWFFTQNENDLFGGVVFTPGSRAQVDGYLLPNPDNSIGLAICKVPASVVGEKLMKALVTECLARSLGLPSLLDNRFDLSLGQWNLSHEKLSKTVSLDGYVETIFPKKPDAPVKSEQAKELVRKFTDETHLYTELQPYDRALIALLYCPRLKPGMDKYQAIDALLGTNECLESSLPQD